MIDENNPSQGKETLKGDSEPTQKVEAHLRFDFVLSEGKPILIVTIHLGESMGYFQIQDENLEGLYLRIREFMEGKGKRAAYLG